MHRATYLIELENVSVNIGRPRNRNSLLQVKFCSIFPGLTCCFGSKLRMQNFYSNGMSSEISSNSSLF